MCSSSPSTVPSEQQTMMHSTSVVPTVLATPMPIVARPSATISESVYLLLILLPHSIPMTPPKSTAKELARTPNIRISP